MKKILLIILLIAGARQAHGMQAAINVGNRTTVIRLLNEGADINARINVANTTALDRAAQLGRLEIVELLIMRGADIEQGMNNHSPLHNSVRSGADESVRMLLQHKANTDTQNEFGQTPLMTACVYHLQGIFNLLLERGADSSITDYDGRTADWYLQRSNIRVPIKKSKEAT